MTKTVFSLMIILGCSNVLCVGLQKPDAGSEGQTSRPEGSQKDPASKHKDPGSAGGVDTLTMSGIWKLNESKSKFAYWAPKKTAVYSEGDKVKVTVDGTDEYGKPTHSEWIGKFDGKDYPVIGDSRYDTRSYKAIDDHTLELTAKKDGKVVRTGRIVVSLDGKRRTIIENGVEDPAGRSARSVAVYDKQ